MYFAAIHSGRRGRRDHTAELRRRARSCRHAVRRWLRQVRRVDAANAGKFHKTGHVLDVPGVRH